LQQTDLVRTFWRSSSNLSFGHFLLHDDSATLLSLRLIGGFPL
jgi:hypothetical protein